MYEASKAMKRRGDANNIYFQGKGIDIAVQVTEKIGAKLVENNT